MNDIKQDVNESKKKLIKKLDECGRNWVPIKCKLEKARLLKDQTWLPKWLKICELAVQVFELYGGYEKEASVDELTFEAVWKILTEDVLQSFDPAEYNDKRYSSASLYLFIKCRIDFRKKDILKKQNGDYKIESFDAPINTNRDEDLRREDVCTSEEIDQYEKLQICESAADIFRKIAMILSINSKRGKGIKYYQVMYTSDIISNEKQYDIGIYRFQHERELDNELNNDFVNYCMEDECQGIRGIYYSKLKKYGEVVKDIGRHVAEEPIPIPMEDKVAISFLGVSKGYYSRRYGKYLELIEEIKNR